MLGLPVKGKGTGWRKKVCKIYYYTNIYGEVWCGGYNKKPWTNTNIPEDYWSKGLVFYKKPRFCKLKPYTNREGITYWFGKNPDHNIWYQGEKYLYPRERPKWKSKSKLPIPEYLKESILNPCFLL